MSDDFQWTYTKNPAATWPPSWLPVGSSTLEDNKPIKAGLERMFAYAGASLQGAETSLGTIKGLRDDLREFRLRESKLNDLATTDDRTDLDNRMRGKLQELIVMKTAIDAKLKAARQSGMLKDYSLGREYNELVDQSKTQSDQAFKVVHDAAPTPAAIRTKNSSPTSSRLSTASTTNWSRTSPIPSTRTRSPNSPALTSC